MKNLILVILLGGSIFAAFNAKAAETNNLSEKDIIVSTLYFEARSEQEAGIRAVASIIYNRAHEKRWSKLGMAGVCTQKLQFSCHNNGVKLPKPKSIKDKQMLKVCEKVAEEMISGKFKPTHNNNHYVTVKFFNASKSSHWCKKMTNCVIIRNHIFGRI